MSSKQKYFNSIQRLAKRARIALRPFVVSIVLPALLMLTPGSKTFAQVEFDRLMKAVPFDQLQIKVDKLKVDKREVDQRKVGTFKVGTLKVGTLKVCLNDCGLEAQGW